MATVFDNYAVNVPYGDKTINLGLWDTAGQDEYAQFRPLSYDQADGFILAFSLVDRASFDNVASAWIRELRAKAPDAPIVLVGTKMDLRRDDGARESAKRPSAPAATKNASWVSAEMGEKMREKIGAAAYVECSALTQDNLKKVFETAIDVNMRAGKKRIGGDADGAGKSSKSGCCVVS
jgi:Ras-related C3 botulinum toxin substrate 1